MQEAEGEEEEEKEEEEALEEEAVEADSAVMKDRRRRLLVSIFYGDSRVSTSPDR